tara:strand:+ start:3888 stop:4175 length:288 start_codon:yes stop_codon:yes gene_type:complete
MRKFKCTKAWVKNRVGDVIDNYIIQRYPSDIRANHFTEVVDVPQVKVKPQSKVEIKPEPTNVVKQVVLKQINTTESVKPKNIEHTKPSNYFNKKK